MPEVGKTLWAITVAAGLFCTPASASLRQQCARLVQALHLPLPPDLDGEIKDRALEALTSALDVQRDFGVVVHFTAAAENFEKWNEHLDFLYDRIEPLLPRRARRYARKIFEERAYVHYTTELPPQVYFHTELDAEIDDADRIYLFPEVWLDEGFRDSKFYRKVVLFSLAVRMAIKIERLFTGPQVDPVSGDSTPVVTATTRFLGRLMVALEHQLHLQIPVGWVHADLLQMKGSAAFRQAMMRDHLSRHCSPLVQQLRYSRPQDAQSEEEQAFLAWFNALTPHTGRRLGD